MEENLVSAAIYKLAYWADKKIIYWIVFLHLVMVSTDTHLTDAQKKVLCGLTAYPSHGDRELAEVLSMKRSTVTVARHFIEEQKLLEACVFPNFQAFRVPLVGIKYGDYGKHVPVRYSQRMKLLSPELKIEENVFSISSEYKGMSVFFASGLYPIKEKIDAWNTLFEGIDPSVAIRDIYLPREMVCHYKFLRTQPRLASLLNIDSLEEVAIRKPLKRPLRAKEVEVLLAWMKEPHATNAILAEKTGISRAIVGAIKQRLLDGNVVTLLQNPHWKRFGATLGVLLYLRAQDRPLFRSLLERPEIILGVGSKHEQVLLGIFRDYQEYALNLAVLVRRLRSEGVCTKEPEELLFTLDETTFSLNPQPFTKKFYKL